MMKRYTATGSIDPNTLVRNGYLATVIDPFTISPTVIPDLTPQLTIVKVEHDTETHTYPTGVNVWFVHFPGGMPGKRLRVYLEDPATGYKNAAISGATFGWRVPSQDITASWVMGRPVAGIFTLKCVTTAVGVLAMNGTLTGVYVQTLPALRTVTLTSLTDMALDSEGVVSKILSTDGIAVRNPPLVTAIKNFENVNVTVMDDVFLSKHRRPTVGGEGWMAAAAFSVGNTNVLYDSTGQTLVPRNLFDDWVFKLRGHFIGTAIGTAYVRINCYVTHANAAGAQVTTNIYETFNVDITATMVGGTYFREFTIDIVDPRDCLHVTVTTALAGGTYAPVELATHPTCASITSNKYLRDYFPTPAQIVVLEGQNVADHCVDELVTVWEAVPGEVLSKEIQPTTAVYNVYEHIAAAEVIYRSRGLGSVMPLPTFRMQQNADYASYEHNAPILRAAGLFSGLFDSLKRGVTTILPTVVGSVAESVLPGSGEVAGGITQNFLSADPHRYFRAAAPAGDDRSGLPPFFEGGATAADSKVFRAAMRMRPGPRSTREAPKPELGAPVFGPYVTDKHTDNMFDSEGKPIAHVVKSTITQRFASEGVWPVCGSAGFVAVSGVEAAQFVLCLSSTPAPGVRYNRYVYETRPHIYKDTRLESTAEANQEKTMNQVLERVGFLTSREYTRPLFISVMHPRLTEYKIHEGSWSLAALVAFFVSAPDVCYTGMLADKGFLIPGEVAAKIEFAKSRGLMTGVGAGATEAVPAGAVEYDTGLIVPTVALLRNLGAAVNYAMITSSCAVVQHDETLISPSDEAFLMSFGILGVRRGLKDSWSEGEKNLALLTKGVAPTDDLLYLDKMPVTKPKLELTSENEMWANLLKNDFDLERMVDDYRSYMLKFNVYPMDHVKESLRGKYKNGEKGLKELDEAVGKMKSMKATVGDYLENFKVWNGNRALARVFKTPSGRDLRISESTKNTWVNNPINNMWTMFYGIDHAYKPIDEKNPKAKSKEEKKRDRRDRRAARFAPAQPAGAAPVLREEEEGEEGETQMDPE